QSFIERTLRKTERRARDGGPEDIERPHRQLEPIAFRSQSLSLRNAATLEGERGERMRSHEIDAPRDRKARRSGVHDKRADAAGGGGPIGPQVRGARARKHTVE